MLRLKLPSSSWVGALVPAEELKDIVMRDFPGGAVVKNLPANAGDTGLSPGPGGSHMLWSN